MDRFFRDTTIIYYSAIILGIGMFVYFFSKYGTSGIDPKGFIAIIGIMVFALFLPYIMHKKTFGKKQKVGSVE